MSVLISDAHSLSLSSSFFPLRSGSSLQTSAYFSSQFYSTSTFSNQFPFNFIPAQLKMLKRHDRSDCLLYFFSREIENERHKKKTKETIFFEGPRHFTTAHESTVSKIENQESCNNRRINNHHMRDPIK